MTLLVLPEPVGAEAIDLDWASFLQVCKLLGYLFVELPHYELLLILISDVPILLKLF